MTQEEKAKAYDEAIKRAKKCLNETRDNCFVSPDVIFPELKVKESKESEDERIRKDLIVFLVAFWHLGRNGSYDSWTKADCSDWLAWVEKQGKKVDAIENFDTEFEKQVSHLLASAINKEYEYTEGFVKWVSNSLLGYAKHEIETQREQKSAWNEEDNKWIESLIQTFEDGYLIGFEQLESYGVIDWLESLKGKIYRETKFITTREKNLKKTSDNADDFNKKRI